MVLQTSGAISLADIAAEFGGSAPHSLSEYYGAATGVPASGAISIGTFYGKSAAQTVTLNSNEQEMNLRTKAVALGWNGSSALIFVINTGKYVWSDNVTVAALTTGTNFPNGLTIVNKGYIMGRGGNADHSSQNGQAGGPAIELNVPVTIDNSNGYIGGGGGGGAGNFGGGGAGGVKTFSVIPILRRLETKIVQQATLWRQLITLRAWAAFRSQGLAVPTVRHITTPLCATTSTVVRAVGMVD